MAIKENYPKTVRLNKSSGIYIIFNDYEHEENFEGFIRFVASKLNVPISPIIEHPYSCSVAIKITGVDVIGMFHGDTGCCIWVPPGKALLADQIVVACYG